MGFFNSLRNIKRWFTNKTGITVSNESTKRKHDECETISNKRVRMDDSLVEVVEISDESLSETEEVEITEPGPSTMPLKASPPVMLIDGKHHQRTKSPTKSVDLTKSNNENHVRILKSFSFVEKPFVYKTDMGMVKCASSKPSLEDKHKTSMSSISGLRKSFSSMESGFSGLSINNSTSRNDTDKTLAMILKNYVATKSENAELSATSSRSPLSIRKEHFLNQSNLSQTSGKENLKIPELSFHKNRIIKHETFYERILRKFKEKQEAASQVFTTIKPQSPDDIFRERFEVIRKELEKLEPLKKKEIIPCHSEDISNFVTQKMIGPPSEIIVKGKNIRRCDLKTLYLPHGWLNDEVINHYCGMIVERDPNNLFAFDTFFYNKLCTQGYQSVRRWSRKRDLFACKKIFIPVHLGNHWCMICVNFTDKTILYYDSFNGKNSRGLDAIFNYLKEEHKNKKNEEFDCSGWRVMHADNCPSQKNTYDCGVFACVNAEYLARDAMLDFTQEDMPLLRQKLCYEIINNRLFY